MPPSQRAVPAVAFLLTVRFEHIASVPAEQRIREVTDLGGGFHRVIAVYGFIQQPDVPALVAEIMARVPTAHVVADVTYFLGRESFVGGKGGRMGVASERAFRALARNAMSATAYFQLPPEQVVEVGVQIDL